jgi:putative transposase
LEQLLESQRILYNAALEERIGAYRRGVTLRFFDQARSLTQWRQSDPEARSIPANLQRATLKRLDRAYEGFFRRAMQKGDKAGFPRFRGKGWWKSFAFAEFRGITFDGARLRFKGMPGALRVHMHRPLPQGEPIRSCVFCRDTKGWKVGLAINVPVSPLRDGDRKVGVDVGISVFAALSDGGFIPSLRAARRSVRRIRVAQRSLARKRAGSKCRDKAKMQLARCHAATVRVRTNFLHQASARLVRDYDSIAAEALNLPALARTMLARDVHDASWGRFLSMLRYKAERAGVRLFEVDPRNTTQDCSGCGVRVEKTLAGRWHECPMCGLSIDRDLNAARNILYRAGVGPGLRNVVGCDIRAGGNPNAIETLHEASRRQVLGHYPTTGSCAYANKWPSA